MKIKMIDVRYQLEMDSATIQDIAYCAIVAGRVDIAFELLSNSIHTPEAARKIVDRTLAGIKSKQTQMIEKNHAETKTEESSK